MRVILLSAVILAAPAVAASDQAEETSTKPAAEASAPATSTPVDWTRSPSCPKRQYYPTIARRAGKPGKASIRCMVGKSGMPTQCRILSEDPPGLGFGEAALQLSDCFRFRPKMVDGLAVESEVTIPMTFNLP